MAFFHSFVNDVLTNPFYRTSSTATENIRHMAQMMDSMVIESSSTATFSFPRIASNFNSANVSKAPVKRIAAASPKYVRQESQEKKKIGSGKEEDEEWRNSLRRSSMTNSSRPPFNFPLIKDRSQPLTPIHSQRPSSRVDESGKSGSNVKMPVRRKKVQMNKCSQPSKKIDNSPTERHNEKLISKIALDLGCERYLVETIEREVLQRKPNVAWESIAGLKQAKSLLQEAVVLPNIVPDFFQGIRRPWKGVLLVGPPGTGKTLLAKAVATECKSTFFNVTSSTLTSKFRGESEKLVRILFHMARCLAPSIIFIDEVDCLVGRQNATHDHDASRRFQAELLIQMDGLQEQSGDKSILVLAASNHPWLVDEAFRRRFEKRIYIPLPKGAAREEMLKLHLNGMKLDPRLDLQKIAKKLEGYSGADILSVCRDGAMMSLRRKIADKSTDEIQKLTKEDLEEPITSQDFQDAIKRCKTSVSPSDISAYDTWMKEFGSY